LTALEKNAKVVSKKESMKKPLKIAPFGKHLGIEILEVGEGVARLKMPYRHELTNPAGNLHGGAIATVADSAMAVAIGSVVGTSGLHFTVKLEIRYKAAVTDGMIIAEAKVTRRKPRLFLGEAVVTNADGQVIATATGTFMVRDHTPEDE
jgi:acyl-CoA thioesterase